MLSFVSPKGGVGCSVVAAATAVLASRHRPTLLVDLGGDQADILGVAGTGVLGAWLDAAPDLLHRLEQPVSDLLSLLPLGSSRTKDHSDRVRLLANMLAADTRTVVVDVGTRSDAAQSFLDRSAKAVAVTRNCYLACRRMEGLATPDELVLVNEPGRGIDRSDVEASVGRSVVAEVKWDPRVGRAVDSGLVVRRLPRELQSLEVLL